MHCFSVFTIQHTVHTKRTLTKYVLQGNKVRDGYVLITGPFNYDCLEIGRKFVMEFFPHHQCLITVRQDREHLHCHIITNTVSFIDGEKLHQSKHDLERQKKFTNNLCRSMGLSVAEKWKHFDGSKIEDVHWSEKRKHITFEDDNGDKVRDTNLSKTFSINISKDILLSEFEEHEKAWLDKLASEQEQLDKYYAEVEDAISHGIEDGTDDDYDWDR